MKKLLSLIIILCLATATFAQKTKQIFVSADIDNFWNAYDKINATKDSAQQYKLLKDFYLDKGTPGLKSLIKVRNYSEKEFISWMTQYPKFWSSLKPNTLKVKSLYPKINANIQKLKKVYPDLKPATIYFSFGAFRTGGTIDGNRVLIGSELSLADKTSDESSILKNLDENIVFEVRKNWKTIFEIEGLSKFKEYLNSSDQQLCGKNFKIRSSWSFSLPNVTIGVKYFPPVTEKDMHPTQKYEQIRFVLNDKKIASILYEN
ncbi:hypothetical protein QW060_03625 [Myroides ceti]|uniref:DUF547 domain-containing protein n=1 Tax=Paenimyroides ceti TaxID=395087 RepID=A0ABT8CPY9_9FLAO|nr:hypothetical protein [Paenimyroides ceti]MDN3706211.1 hypothetical protein [Paenimyroides ceti]